MSWGWFIDPWTGKEEEIYYPDPPEPDWKAMEEEHYKDMEQKSRNQPSAKEARHD